MILNNIIDYYISKYFQKSQMARNSINVIYDIKYILN